ncbi:hypothetical protein GCM10007304_47090 [Rhodococcoides trifolii]|uniref:Uncharacterized protein n=1 Tax=Rhodococcoides trifolii TaxID=908250 RepID=A0A917G853_9NOCA|nr:hypothetical protein [Rhodococcus trifolii]GGG27844.1 hypothetical protein GCM10007304_47090 [Rhodococcus trifolii]
MTAPFRVLTTSVQTVEGQFRIRADQAVEDPWRRIIDAITEFRHGALMVMTGATYGPVEVAIEEYRARPETLDVEWDVITERDFTSLPVTNPAPGGPLGSAVRIGNINDSQPETILTERVGLLRMRFHARDRDRARRLGDLTEIVERYLIQVWPATRADTPMHVLGTDSVMEKRIGGGTMKNLDNPNGPPFPGNNLIPRLNFPDH